MDSDKRFDAMAEECMVAHEAIKAHGTPEMQALMRLLLFQIGQAIAQCDAERRATREDE